MSKLSYLAAGAAVFVFSASPAFADLQIPEPATMSLFGVGAVAAALIGRYRRRK